MTNDKQVIVRPTQQAKPKKSKKKKPQQSQLVRTYEQPVTRGFTLSKGVPTFQGGPRGGVRIKHTETFVDLPATLSSQYVITIREPINPGLPHLFPWLANIARNYETYRFHALRFWRLPSSTTNATGAVYMAYDYDPSDSEPASRLEFFANSSVSRAPIWDSQYLDLDCGKASSFVKQRFVRSRNVPGDIKTYDAAKFYMATSSGASIDPGELFVSYDVELFTPSPRATDEGVKIQTDQGNLTSPLNGATTTNEQVATVLSGTQVSMNEVGDYMAVLHANGSTPSVGVTGPAITQGTTLSDATNFLRTFYFSVLNAGTILTLAGAGAAIGNMRLTITRLDKSAF